MLKNTALYLKPDLSISLGKMLLLGNSQFVVVGFFNHCKCHCTKKMKFSIKDFLRKCDQIRRKLQLWSHLLKKSLMKNFIFCAVCFDVPEKYSIFTLFNLYFHLVTIHRTNKDEIKKLFFFSTNIIVQHSKLKSHSHQTPKF